MKKKIRIVIIIIIVLLILFFPIPKGHLDDGSRVYSALTYKIVKWKYYDEKEGWGHTTFVYWFPDNFKNINELREMYKADIG